MACSRPVLLLAVSTLAAGPCGFWRPSPIFALFSPVPECCRLPLLPCTAPRPCPFLRDSVHFCPALAVLATWRVPSVYVCSRRHPWRAPQGKLVLLTRAGPPIDCACFAGEVGSEVFLTRSTRPSDCSAGMAAGDRPSIAHRRFVFAQLKNFALCMACAVLTGGWDARRCIAFAMP